jgi:hypothetical protein
LDDSAGIPHFEYVPLAEREPCPWVIDEGDRVASLARDVSWWSLPRCFEAADFRLRALHVV